MNYNSFSNGFNSNVLKNFPAGYGINNLIGESNENKIILNNNNNNRPSTAPSKKGRGKKFNFNLNSLKFQ